MSKQLLSLTLALTGVLTFTLPSIAQDAKPGAGPGGPGGPHHGPGGGPLNPEERIKHMKETLELTDDQVAKLKPIFEKIATEAKAIHDDASVKPEDKRQKVGELMKNSREEIDSILTPAQREKAKAEREKMRGGGRKPGGAPGGAPGAK